MANQTNKKIIYMVIGVTAIASMTVYPTQISGFDFSFPFNQNAIKEARALEISLQNVSITDIDSNKIKINTIFDVYNPNEGTLILESIHYDVNVENMRIVSGDIGEQPEGFIDSQAGIYPIIGNGTMTLKDEKIEQKNERIVDILDKITGKNTVFQVKGYFSYKQTSSFQATGGEIDFELTYPRMQIK